MNFRASGVSKIAAPTTARAMRRSDGEPEPESWSLGFEFSAAPGCPDGER
jgi:hypothetical protein